MKLSGKTAIVTGGASGFGAGIVKCFAQEGANVVVADVNLDAARETASAIGETATAVLCDVTKLAGFEAALEYAHKNYGGFDILVNNAGIGQRPTALEDVEDALFDQIFDVNIRSIFNGAKCVVPTLKKNGGGVILNVASTGAVRPRPNLTWYNASKGWVTAATRGMAIELAPHNIRVNAINPVAGATPMLATFMQEDSDDGRQSMIDTIPLGRLSTPQDMGQAAAFLCSDEAQMITGVALEVDGGRCI
ncbi:MAG: glucose 1-dehydrogenase [Pseudomonadota bacterium]